MKRVAARWEATTAEAMAGCYAVELAHRLGYTSLVLEGDAISVVKVVEHKQDGAAPLFRIYDD